MEKKLIIRAVSGGKNAGLVQVEKLLNLLPQALFHPSKSAQIEQNLGSKPAAKQ